MIAAPSAGTLLRALDPGPEQQPQPRTQENELQQPVEHRVLLRHRKTTGGQAAGTTTATGRDAPGAAAGTPATSSAGRATMEGQRRQGGALWASCPARSRSPPTAARLAWCSATASPARTQSLRPWAEHLAAAGLTVRLPRLPGHGTRWQDLNDTRWPDWYGEVERAFDDLRGRCRQVFAMGLSMGGTLVTRLAEQRPAEVAGLVLVNPSLGSERKDVKYALPLLHRVVPSLRRDRQRHPQARRDRARVRADAAAGDALAVAALAAGRSPTSAGSPRRCCSTAAGSTTSSSRCPAGCCGTAPPRPRSPR